MFGLRTLAIGFGAAAVGMLVACNPTEDADVNQNGDVDPQCLLRSCTSTSGGIFDPKTGGETKPPPVKYSYCRSVQIDQIENGQGVDSLPGNTRLVPIVEDSVPCVHIEERKTTRCKWTGEAGLTAVSKMGKFALVGTTLAEDGKPDGDFVVGTPVQVTKDPKTGAERYEVACSAPKPQDSAGTPVAAELAGACVVETMNSAVNATGKANDNYATRQVCSTPVSAPVAGADYTDDTVTASKMDKGGGVICFTGEGAGMNDSNGTERDVYNIYLTGADRCHVVWNSGIETMAAKRPEVKGYPKKVNEASEVIWRTAITGIVIAN